MIVLAVILAILQVLLWLLIAVVGLLVLVLLLCGIPIGAAASNLRGETWAWLKIGFLRIRLTPKKPLTEKQKAKKEQKKKRKAEKKALKKAKKQEAKANIKTSAPAGKHTGKQKPPKQKDTKLMIRAILASLADYDDEYLKLICIRRLNVTLNVGGGSPEATGKRYGKTAQLFGCLYPLMMCRMNIKHHQIAVRPDFVTNRTSLFYDVVVTVRPICLLKSAIVFWCAFCRNRRIFRTPKQEQTISTDKRPTPAKETA